MFSYLSKSYYDMFLPSNEHFYHLVDKYLNKFCALNFFYQLLN